jgi:hypothetical protein
MRSREILELQREHPFPGYRVYLTDGAQYEVRHPEMMMVIRDRVFIAIPPKRGEDVPEKSVYCDPLHITGMEPLNGGKKPRPRKPKAG